jgi:hypothetical protein
VSIDWPLCADCKKSTGSGAVSVMEQEREHDFIYPTGEYLCPECSTIRDAARRLSAARRGNPSFGEVLGWSDEEFNKVLDEEEEEEEEEEECR